MWLGSLLSTTVYFGVSLFGDALDLLRNVKKVVMLPQLLIHAHKEVQRYTKGLQNSIYNFLALNAICYALPPLPKITLPFHIELVHLVVNAFVSKLYYYAWRELHPVEKVKYRIEIGGRGILDFLVKAGIIQFPFYIFGVRESLWTAYVVCVTLFLLRNNFTPVDKDEERLSSLLTKRTSYSFDRGFKIGSTRVRQQ